MINHRLDPFCFNKPIAIGVYQTAPYICINSNKEIDSLAQLWARPFFQSSSLFFHGLNLQQYTDQMILTILILPFIQPTSATTGMSRSLSCVAILEKVRLGLPNG